MARYRIGNDMTVVWSIYDHTGAAYNLKGKEVRLYYTCERGRFEVDFEIQGTNKVVWSFLGREQKVIGDYTLSLEIIESAGKRRIFKDYCNAFTLVGKSCEETALGNPNISEDGNIVLSSKLDVYKIQPIIPTVGSNSNWFVDGTDTGKPSTGKSAYEYAKEKGYEGTESEYAESLKLAPENSEKLAKLSEEINGNSVQVFSTQQGVAILHTDKRPLALKAGQYKATLIDNDGVLSKPYVTLYFWNEQGEIILSAPTYNTGSPIILDEDIVAISGYLSELYVVKTGSLFILLEGEGVTKALREEIEEIKESNAVFNSFGESTTNAISQHFVTEILSPYRSKTDLTQQSEAGYVKTSVGAAPSLVAHATRRHIIISVEKGDIFSYDAMGGTSGRSIAFVQNGIITYVSDAGAVKADIVADGTYDQIIFNYDDVHPKHISQLGQTIVIETKKPLEGKNVIIFGDSSTAGTASSGTNWFSRMCEDLGAENYRNYASGGQTILNQEGVTTNYLKASIETAISNINSQWDRKVDVIMLQIGGNDINYMSQKGSIEDAFASRNYLDYKDDKTIYGSLRYCLEHLQRTFPDALITMGTVFGRLGSDIYGGTKEINEIITNVCDVLKIQIIDGGRYMGFSYLELNFPYYNDVNKGVENDRTALSRENPAFSYIDANGNIVTYEEATNNGEIKSGYSKRYGLYTYDGKHQTQRGEDKVKRFMQSQIAMLIA